MQRSTELKMSLKEDLGKAAVAAAFGLAVAAGPAQAITKSELNQLSYLQVKGTGLANRCPEVVGEDTITPKSGQKLTEMCIEPKAWAVEEEIGELSSGFCKLLTSNISWQFAYAC